jgi:hypothetical protein
MPYSKFNRKQPSPAATRGDRSRPSYLSEVKQALTERIAENHTSSAVEEIVADLWPFLSKRLAESYWNGVSAGASGRVKPKPRSPRDCGGDRGDNAELR